MSQSATKVTVKGHTKKKDATTQHSGPNQDGG